MVFLLHGKKFSKEIGNQIGQFINDLKNLNFTILSTISFHKHLQKLLSTHNNKIIQPISNIDEVKESIDYLICFGGDGTILNAATIVNDNEIPIVGINTGRLGFLASISKFEISTLIHHLIKKNIN